MPRHLELSEGCASCLPAVALRTQSLVIERVLTKVVDKKCSIVVGLFWVFRIFSKHPTMVSVVNHLSGHASVYADVLACDETSLFGAEK